MKIFSIAIIPNTFFPKKDRSFEKIKEKTAERKELFEISPNNYYSKIEVNRSIMQKYPKYTKNNFEACLLGGAIGDALGYPVEFLLKDIIKLKYGNGGITDLQLQNGKSLVTDDTQMTFFTSDGLLKSIKKGYGENTEPDYNIIYKSYQNWLNTQTKDGKKLNENQGWVTDIKGLYALRAPGNTCLGSLRKGIAGSIEKPINESKGCGGVMRAAPAGLIYYKNPELAFKVGAQCAALTHGNPSAYLPAGVMASIIANIIQGKSLENSVNNSMEILKKYKGHEDTLYLLKKAKLFAKSDIVPTEAIKRLGAGWHGDEAIAISVYCALKYQDNFKQALITAVNHDGDSDSTGSMVGNILGAYLGKEKIPANWVNKVELSKELINMANQLYFSTPI